jgi:ferritin
MQIQQMEERFHDMKFYHFILAHGGKVELKALDQPQTDFESPMQIFCASLDFQILVVRNCDVATNFIG